MKYLLAALLLLTSTFALAQSVEPGSVDNDPRCEAPQVTRAIQDFSVSNTSAVDYFAPWGITGGACGSEDLSPVWSIADFPAGFSIDAGTGRITGTWPADVLVMPSITLTTTKGFTTDSFSVTVGDPNSPVAGSRIGVPDLPWLSVATEATPDRPADWSDEVAGYYYVDYENGSNANTFGRPGAPRQTLPRPIPAGSYVEMANDYNFVSGGIIAIEAAGTEQNPVWVTKADGQPLSIFGGPTLGLGSYLYIDGLVFNSSGAYTTFQFGSVTSGYTYDHVMLRNSTLNGHIDSNAGISSTQDSGDTSSYSLVYNNTIIGHGDPDTPIDDDVTLIGATDGTLNVYIFDNVAHGTPGACVQLGTGSVTFRPVTDAYVNGNEFYECRQSGIWSKNILRGVISQNKVHDVNNRCLPVNDSSPSKGIGGQYFLEEYWIIANEIYNTGYGVSFASTNGGHGTKATVAYNYLYDIEPQGGGCTIDVVDPNNPFSGSMVHVRANNHVDKDILVAHNTGVRVQAGINISTPNAGGSLDLYANIIDTVTNADGYQIYDSSAAATSSFNVLADGNSGNGDTIDVRVGSTPYTSLATLQGATSIEQNTSVDDPVYVNEGQNDLRLDATSPHRTGATDGGLKARFLAAFGFALTEDMNGVAFPAGANDWSVGAAQYEAP